MSIDAITATGKTGNSLGFSPMSGLLYGLNGSGQGLSAVAAQVSDARRPLQGVPQDTVSLSDGTSGNNAIAAPAGYKNSSLARARSAGTAGLGALVQPSADAGAPSAAPGGKGARPAGTLGLAQALAASIYETVAAGPQQPSIDISA